MRRLVVLASQHGIPVPALSASLAYFDSFRAGLLRSAQCIEHAPHACMHMCTLTCMARALHVHRSAQCIQAQRDAFGGHGFQRLDKPGTHNAVWR